MDFWKIKRLQNFETNILFKIIEDVRKLKSKLSNSRKY